jgi:hypothetical protein
MYNSVSTVEAITRDSQSCEQLFQSLHSTLTAREWVQVRAHASPARRLTHFHTLWSLKEAFVKAWGPGLAFNPQGIEFTFNSDGGGHGDGDGDGDVDPVAAPMSVSFPAQRRTAGAAVPPRKLVPGDWHFHRHRLDDTHIVSVAYGPADFSLFDTCVSAPPPTSTTTPTTATATSAAAVETPPPFQRVSFASLMPKSASSMTAEASAAATSASTSSLVLADSQESSVAAPSLSTTTDDVADADDIDAYLLCF